jgi:hypothetical protein
LDQANRSEPAAHALLGSGAAAVTIFELADGLLAEQ